jgi:hypothetical protein
MERLLSAHEAMMVAGDMRVVTVWEVQGDIDEQGLEYALQQLVRRYPVLGGNLSLQDGRAYVRITDEHTAPVRLHRVPELPEELNVGSDWSEGPLLRMTLITKKRTHYIVTTLPRACVDGTSIIALQQAFWSLYTAACSGQRCTTPPIQPILPSAIEDEFHHKYSPADLRDYVAQRAQTDARMPPARLPSLASAGEGPGPDMTFGAARVSVDPASTSSLVEIAHRNALSVNSLVCGLFAAAVRPSLGPAAGPVSVCCGVAVDMRRRVTPPIPDEVLQSAASGLPIRLAVDVPTDPLALGRELSKSLRENLDAGTAERELAAFPYMAKQCPPTFFVTNLGRIPAPSLPENHVVTGLRILPMARIPTLFVVVTRFGQHLHIDLPFSRAWYTDAQIDDIVSQTRSVIEKAVSLHDPAAKDRGGPYKRPGEAGVGCTP